MEKNEESSDANERRLKLKQKKKTNKREPESRGEVVEKTKTAH